MVKVIFKNLEKSDLVRGATIDRVSKALEKACSLESLASTVVLSREHSRDHSGIEEFTVKLMIGAPGMKPVIVEKRSSSLYQALAIGLDRALDILHQSFSKQRLGLRHERRRFKTRQRWRQSFATWNQSA